MFVSRKKMKTIEKRLAELERKVQNQPLEIISALQGHQREQLTKSGSTRHQEK